MSKSFKFVLILLVTGFSCLLIFPTINWYFFIKENERKISSYSKEVLRSYSKIKTRDDLLKLKDLYFKNPSGFIPNELLYLIKIAKNNYKLSGKVIPKSFNIESLRGGFLSDSEIENLSYEIYRYYDDIKKGKSKIIQLGLDLSGGMSITISLDYSNFESKFGRSLSSFEKNESVKRTMKILKERIDTFGLTEPRITREARGNRIFLDIPGEKDENRIASLLSGKGSLMFYVVDNEATDILNQRKKEMGSGPFFSIDKLKKNMSLKDDRKIFPWYVKDIYGIDDESSVKYYVVDVSRESSFDGSHIKDADISNDHITGRDIVVFNLDSKGAEKFFDYTKKNTGKLLAVVVEGKIKSVASINSAIAGGNVSIQGDSFNKEEAKELALVFKTASFPVKIKIDDLRVIGPKLGSKTIEFGIKASMLALALVFVFMVIYYKTSGLIAGFSLVFYNLFLILSILSMFNFTLTLTSIAGLVLTMGMAVDINIIIYERIKEEMRKGVKFEIAFDNGFKKAFWAIMDSNVTTFIAVFFLTFFGTGAIQGFAWSLSIGIISSLFSSLIFSRFILEFVMSLNKNKFVSISWSSKYAKSN